jgi:formate-nitrite transporter family protein
MADDRADGSQPDRPSDTPSSIEKPEAGTRLSAAQIHDNIVAPAEKEMARSAGALICSAFASGLTIGFSFLTGAYAETLVAERYANFAAGIAYPIGFVFVVISRSELFTENTLEPVIPVLHKRDRQTLGKMFRLWGLLLAGNLAGAALFAWVMFHSRVIGDPVVRERLLTMAIASTSDGVVMTFTRAIMAGWLIALLTWLLASTHETVAHVILVWLTTAPIAWLEFRHSIVGAVEAFYRFSAGAASFGGVWFEFIVPAVLGNAVGGVVLVALLNYGQVRAERGSFLTRHASVRKEPRAS